MKTSTQVTITPLLIDSLKCAVDAMKNCINNSDLIAEAQKTDGGIASEVCRAAITNTAIHRAALKQLIATASEQLEIKPTN